ncbi:hypothetical protein Tco_0817401 [Tanacetum coccineum]
MSTPTFAATHNLIAFLEKPIESKGFEQIIDFLNAKPIKYALTENPTVYTSCIKQFWATAKVKKVNGQDQIQAQLISRSAKTTAWNESSSTMASVIICLANNQKFNFSKYILDNMVKNLEGVFANMRRQADGFSGRVTPLFDTMMVQASEEVGEDSDHPTDSNHIPIDTQPSISKPHKKQKPRRKQRQDYEVPLPTNEIPVKESVLTPSNGPLPSGEDGFQLNELMVLCTSLQKQVFDLEKVKTSQAKEIATLKKRVKNLERRRRSRLAGLRRLRKVGASRRVESSKDKDSLGDQEDPSKQGKSIEDFDADAEITLLNETQDDNLMFDAGVLDDEVVMPGKKEEQGTKFDDMEVSTANEAITTAGVKDSAIAPTIAAAPTITTAVEVVTIVSAPTTTIDELTLAQTLIEINAAKPKTVTAVTTTATTVILCCLSQGLRKGVVHTRVR